MLAPSVRRVLALQAESTRMAAAGRAAAQCRQKPRENSAAKSGTAPPALPLPSKKNTTQAASVGTAAVRSILRIFFSTAVPVSSATSSALVETGLQRSPKNTPDSTAPPTRVISSPMPAAMVEQITPMVAAVPKAVPVSTDTMALSKKVISKKICG